MNSDLIEELVRLFGTDKYFQEANKPKQTELAIPQKEE